VAAAAFGFAGPPAVAAPDQQSLDLRAQLDAFATRMAAPDSRDQPALALIAAAGLTALTRPAQGVPFLASATAAGQNLGQNLGQLPPAGGGISVLRLNMRLGLTMLSQAYGGDDNGTVLAAQPGPDRDALVIAAGIVTLADLRALLQAQGLQQTAPAGPLVLQVPLLVLAGASLQLGPGEVLELSRADGAFVMNFGHLQIQGAAIRSTGAANPASPGFIPFVTTADGGTLWVSGARITGLGFGDTLKFSGFSVMSSMLQGAGRPSRIENSVFEAVMTVAVSATADITLQGNQFRDMRGSALILSRARRAVILDNLFVGPMPTNAIRLEDGAVQALVAGNVVLGGERAGIVVRGSSRDVTLAHNIIWQRDGSGITLLQSDCGRITGNLIIGNGQKGIEVRQSLAAVLRGNTVLSNHSAGIWVSDQPAGTQTLLQDNVLGFNGAGLAAASGADLLMTGNDFSGQFLQFLSGDLAPQSAHIARNMRGDTPMILSAAGRSDLVSEVAVEAGAAPAPETCSG